MQEHWLSSDTLYRIDALLPEFLCFNHSSMDKECSADVLRGRPFGGVSIAVHSILKHSVKLLAAENNFIVIQCSNFIVIDVYLPCRSGRQDYCEVLSDICASIGSVIDCTNNLPFILGGDLNMNLTSIDKGCDLLKRWLAELDLFVIHSTIVHKHEMETLFE